MDTAVVVATKDDFDAIAALNVAAYEEFAPHLEPGGWDLMRANLGKVASRAERGRFLVVRHEGRLIASVAYCPPGFSDPTIFDPATASVLLLSVHPQHRGRGLAKLLVMEAIARARQDQAERIGLFTSELMTAAQRLYHQLGFRHDGDLPRRYGVRYLRLLLDLHGDAAAFDLQPNFQHSRQ
jgi:ribosomal protein S18 acetylase RimI-like enzyme